jgi:hypothetical protein
MLLRVGVYWFLHLIRQVPTIIPKSVVFFSGKKLEGSFFLCFTGFPGCYLAELRSGLESRHCFLGYLEHLIFNTLILL